MCNITDHGYIVRYGDKPEGVLTSETHFDFSDYARKTIEWSVESYVGKEQSRKVERTFELCNFDDPEKPVLNSNSDKNIVLDGMYDFSWKNSGQNKEEMCGVQLTYTYGVSIAPVDKPDAFTNVSETNAVRDITSGRYSWKVITSNGISKSNVSSTIMWFCVPENIP